MSGTWTVMEDVLPMVAFFVAMVAVLMVPTPDGGPVSRDAKGFFAASIGCYLVGTTTSILSHAGLFPESLSPAITSIELLWIPFVLFGVYSLYSRQQLNEAHAAARTVTQTGQMMESILETTPSGIVVLSDAGHVTFANRIARGVLDLEDDAGACSLHALACTVRMGDGEESADMSALVGETPLQDQQVVLQWPSGWRRILRINTAPMLGEDGHVAGAIAAFVEQ